MTETNEVTARERLAAFMEKRGITITSTFVPWSQSRNKDEKHRTLNWHVSLLVKSQVIVSADYSAGIAHCPAYTKAKGMKTSIYNTERIDAETENGREARSNGEFMSINPGKPILPDPQDVIHSLLLDADVIDAGGFEEWASNLGYDADSRKAEATYRTCLEIALKLRNALGDEVFREGQEACQDY